MRSTWNDYTLEFSRLEASMTRAVDRVEKGALAEHIKDSKTFMSEQRHRNDIQDIKSEEPSDLNRIFAPLLPPNEDMNYYVRDHEMNRRNRHSGTCEWILHHPKFLRWSQIPAETGGQLWVNAGPGVGKTVLASFIIDHFLGSGTRNERPILLYFYFNESSLHKNNATAAICSIAYQLHKQQEEDRDSIEMNAKAIGGKAGDERQSDFPEVWKLLSMFLKGQTKFVLILDALDECEDNSLLLPRLLDFATRERIKLLMISRRQKRLLRYLENVETLEITPEDVHNDIKAFVELKVGRNPRLSHPLVRDTIMRCLLSQHEGMFLWVSLMLKELKVCISVEEVQTTLTQIPSGLEGVYIKIIRRLGGSLTRRAAEVTKNILTWVLGSARTLMMDELKEALSCQYRAQGHTLLSDGEFPYTDKDIENMCGSLILIRHGHIQTLHQSTKEYLVGISEDQRLNQGLVILPTLVDTSLQLVSTCLKYQEDFYKSSLAKVEILPFDHRPKDFDICMLQANKKLLDYSCFFWIHHVIGCPIDYREFIVGIIAKHFSGFMTVSWIVLSMLLDSKGLWRLVIGIEELEEWLLQGTSQENLSDAARHLQEWCSGTARLLNAYSTLLVNNPWTIWRLDLKAFFGLEQRYAALGNCFEKSEESEQDLQAFTGSQTAYTKPRLGHNQWSLLKARLGFFVHERKQNIFLSGEQSTSAEGECLFVQHAESGKRLSPATAGLATVLVDEKYHYGHVVTAKVSAQGKYLAVAYDKWLSIWVIKSNLIFSHRLRDQAWAFRLISEKYHKKGPSLITAAMIAFVGDDKLYAPGGWYDLATKEFHALPSALSGQTGVAYSGDCSYLFTKRRNHSSEEIIRQSISVVGLTDPVSSTFDLYAMGEIKSSNTGKYLLSFGKGINGLYRVYGPSETTRSNRASMEIAHLPGTNGFSCFGESSFHFSEDDETLAIFLWQQETRRGVHARMTVTVWELGSGGPKMRSQGHISTVVAAHAATTINLPRITLTSRDLAWIVSCDRSIQTVKFTTDGISFPGYDPPVHELSALCSQVSQDGRRLGIAHAVGSKVYLEVINLPPSGNEGFKLENTFPTIDQVRPICMSSKADLLVIGRLAFIFDSNTSELPLPVECDIDLATPTRDWDWACSMSSCGEYVAFDKPAYKHYLDSHDRQSSRSVIFRINRTKRKATRLMTPYRKNMQAAAPGFHPFLTLAALCSWEGEGSDNNSRSSRQPLVPANELSLSMIHLKEDKLEPLEPLQMTHLVRSSLYFADSGDFLLLEGENTWPQYLQSRIIVSHLPCEPRPLRIIPENRYIHPSKDRTYILNREYNSIDISMYKFQSLGDSSSLPAYQAIESIATVNGLTVFPSTVGWRPEVWLLLGEDYSKRLKLLLQPTNGAAPVLKTLMVSWNELRERLETTLMPVEQIEESDYWSEIDDYLS